MSEAARGIALLERCEREQQSKRHDDEQEHRAIAGMQRRHGVHPFSAKQAAPGQADRDAPPVRTAGISRAAVSMRWPPARVAPISLLGSSEAIEKEGQPAA